MPGLQELREEQRPKADAGASGGDAGASGAPALLLNRDVLERALMARLSEPPPGYPELPLAYLLGCYRRASAAVRSTVPLKDKAAQARLQESCLYCKELSVNYMGLLLTMDMFPQVRPGTARPGSVVTRARASGT